MELTDQSAALLAVVRRLATPDENCAETYEREDDFGILRDAHWPIEDQAWSRSEASATLTSWLDQDDADLRRGAAIALGYIAPGVLLEEVGRRLPFPLFPDSSEKDAVRVADYAEGVHQAVWALGEYYIGDYCPGYLDSLTEDPDAHRQEYERLARVAGPVIEFYRGFACGTALAALLDQVRPEVRPVG